ncbi:MAG: hypothetical protein DFNUSKGM_002912 [Candidatus Fervidibacter sacchari]
MPFMLTISVKAAVIGAWMVILTQVATLKDKAKETVQVVTYNRHHYL